MDNNATQWRSKSSKKFASTKLDAIDDDGSITKQGKEILRLPTHPRIAHILINNKSALATDLAALLEERDPLAKEVGADISLRIEALRKYRQKEKVNAERNVLERIEKLAAQWRRLLNVSIDNSIFSDTAVGKLLIAAYPERIARQQNNEVYKLANGRIAKLPDHDQLMRERWLCIAQLDAGTIKEGKIFMAAAINEKDLYELAHEQETVQWNDEREAVVDAIEKRVGNLVLESKPSKNINDEKRINVLINQVQEKGLKFLNWSEAEEQWQARVHLLKSTRANEDWPDVSDKNLIDTAHEWLSPYLISIAKKSEIDKLNKHDILTSLLPWELQNKINTLAPERIVVPSGSQIKVHYFNDDRAPIMEVRLQELFGLLETPTINEGRTKILLHLLSPGYKPVQVTQDLKSFWQTTYHEVRKELRMRYPKHHWPEDPWTAEAVRGVKKK